MQTPIQKAIEQIKEDATHRHLIYQASSNNAIEILTKLLPYEQECIYDAYDAGVKAMNDRGVEVRALCDVDDWFNETFNQTPVEFDAKKVP